MNFLFRHANIQNSSRSWTNGYVYSSMYTAIDKLNRILISETCTSQDAGEAYREYLKGLWISHGLRTSHDAGQSHREYLKGLWIDK